MTILSRCQRYDFKLIPVQGIARRLDQVLANESIEAEPAAVQVLAREAAGSMRDAMSLLDQVIAFSGTKLTADDVARVLGVADRSILHELGTALLTGDAAKCLSIVARVAEQGFDLGHVAKDVLGHLRNLVVAKVCTTQARDTASLRELLELADEELALVVAQAERVEVDDLTRCFQGFSRSFDDIVRSGQPRMALEMTLVRLARRPPLLPLDELLSRVGELEKRLGGTPPSGPVPRGGGPVRGGVSGPVLPQGSTEPPARTRGSLALAQGVPRAEAFTEPRPSERTHEPPRAVLAPVPLVPVSLAPVPLAPVSLAPVPLVPVSLAPSSSPVVDPQLWYGWVELLRSTEPAVASVFEHALPVEIGPDRVVLTFETATFVAARASEPGALSIMTGVVRKHFGAQTSVIIDASAKAAPGVRTVAALVAERRAAEIAKARATIEDHPLVREAMRVFGAQVRDVRLPSGDG